MTEVPLHVIHLNQDDPRKCTARAMESRGHAELHHHPRQAPKRGILLNPQSGMLQGPEDNTLLNRGGSIVALDCSWKSLDSAIREVSQHTRLGGRTLPVLLAANSVSWGKPGRLTTAEALCASVIISGRWEQGQRIIEPFTFGNEFLNLNNNPLEAYSNAKTNAELAAMQWEFFDVPHSTND